MPDRRTWEKLLGVAAVAVAVVTVALTFVRLRYGVDLADEAFYAALPYSFTLGHLPFIDEQHVLQTAALLTWPLVAVYKSFVGDATGLVLFLREAWLALVLGVGAATFSTLRRLVRWEVALLVALLPVLAVPFTIASLSYNTMSSQLLLLGVVLGAKTVVLGDRPRWLVAAGVAHGLACVAYPTIAVAVVAFSVALVAIERRRALRPVLAYAGGVALIGVGLVVFFAVVGFGNVLAAAAYTRSLSGYAGGAGKFALMLQQVGRSIRWLRVGGAALLLFAVGLGEHIAGERVRWLLLLVPLPLLAGTTLPITVRSLSFVILFGAFATLLLPLARRGGPRMTRLWAWGAVPALVAGAVTGYTSTNGFMNVGIGILPAVVVSGVLLAVSLDAGKALRGAALVAVLGFAAATLVYFQWGVVFHDIAVVQETGYVTAGPYRGMHTSSWRTHDVAELLADVRTYSKPGESILFFNGMPWGYMFSTLRPDTNAVWLSMSDERVPAAKNATMAYLRRMGTLPDVVFRHADASRYAPDSPLTRLVQTRYDLVASHDHWTIWRRLR